MLTRRKQLDVFIPHKQQPHAPHTSIRAGTAFVNDDGSVSIRLDVLPLHGRLELRATPPTGWFRTAPIGLA